MKTKEDEIERTKDKLEQLLKEKIKLEIELRELEKKSKEPETKGK